MENKEFTREEIVTLVNDIFIDSFELEAEDLTPEKHIFMDLGLDSLDMVDLIVGLQKKFNINLRDNEAVREIRTLGDIYDFFSNLDKNNLK
jgi:acyl carrier protein